METSHAWALSYTQEHHISTEPLRCTLVAGPSAVVLSEAVPLQEHLVELPVLRVVVHVEGVPCSLGREVWGCVNNHLLFVLLVSGASLLCTKPPSGTTPTCGAPPLYSAFL